MAVIYTISRGKLLSKREIPKFNHREFEQRVTRARRLMTGERLDGLLVTSEANMEYLSGFTTQFAWNTPTRPWYFLLPRSGKAVGVIPEIGITNCPRSASRTGKPRHGLTISLPGPLRDRRMRDSI
jgi:Xaa-Pro aminopeptidase